MAVSVTSDLTLISDCESTAAGGTHTRLNGTSSGNPAADGDAKVQGANCMANKLGATSGATDVGGHLNLTSTIDLTGKHLFFWRQIVTSGNMDTKANGGVRLGLTNTSTTSATTWSTTNYKLWYMDGGDKQPFSTGWLPYVLDPSSTPNASAGTLTLSTVKNIGFICRQLTGVTTTMSNQFYDAIRMGTGLTVTASSAADAASMADAYSADKTNAWGIVVNFKGVYYLSGKVTIGATNQTNTALMKDTNTTVVWRELPVSSTLYEWLVRGASGFPTTLQLGDKDGSGNTSNGCVYSGENGQQWTITCTTYGIFKAYASTLTNLRSATLSASSELRDVSIVSGGTITPNGATIIRVNFRSPVATQLKINSVSEMSQVTESTFNSSGTGHAIEITAAGVYTFNGIKFNGYAASNGSTGNETVFVNVASGSVTINVSGGGTTPSIRTAGATVTVNNSVTLTLTGLQAGSDIVILTAGTSTILSQADQNSGTTYPYSYSVGGNVDIGVFKAGYVVYYQRNFALPASNASLPISQVVDRNYS